MLKKKNIVILIIVLLLLLISFGVYWFFLKGDVDLAEKNSNQKPGDVVEQPEESIPDFIAEDLKDFYMVVLDDLKTWSSDYRIHSITAMTKSTDINDERVYFGTDGGKFSSWAFEVYSPKKEASVMYIYSNGKGDLGEEMMIDNEYILPSYNSQEYFNDLASLKPTQEVYESAVERGLVTGDTNHIYMYLGSSDITNTYGDRYVWRIDERSNTQVDAEYGIPVVLKSYFIDGKTLEFLK